MPVAWSDRFCKQFVKVLKLGIKKIRFRISPSAQVTHNSLTGHRVTGRIPKTMKVGILRVAMKNTCFSLIPLVCNPIISLLGQQLGDSLYFYVMGEKDRNLEGNQT